MPKRDIFEYAVVRIVPRVEREEFINAGVILFCRSRAFLKAGIELDLPRLQAFAPDLDVDAVQEQLDHITEICRGSPAAGELGRLPLPERFRWLVAPRSTIVQPSPVHTGMCSDPDASLEHLLDTMVRRPPLDRPPAPPTSPA